MAIEAGELFIDIRQQFDADERRQMRCGEQPNDDRYRQARSLVVSAYDCPGGATGKPERGRLLVKCDETAFEKGSAKIVDSHVLSSFALFDIGSCFRGTGSFTASSIGAFNIRTE